MAHSYVVLGAGRQGMAIAYDLAKFGNPSQLYLCDLEARRVRFATNYLNELIGSEAVTSKVIDAGDHEAVARLFREVEACVSAVSYRFNRALSELAVETGIHFCDLGGNTGVVRAQLELDQAAREAGISIVPDCGLAPGMANSMAKYAMERIEAGGGKPQEIRIYCGGLPQEPRPPLNYMLLFSAEGLINEYDYPAHILGDGKVVEVEPLGELEELEPFPLRDYSGPLEAFLTSGGASLAPWQYEGLLSSYVYKTVRYPGHCAQMKLLRDLGLFEEGERRELMIEALNERLPRDDRNDLVLLRVVARGLSARDETPLEIKLELIEYYDPETGFTAMERTTGFSAAIVAQMQASGEIAPGAATPDPAVPAERFMNQLAERGLKVEQSG